MPLIQFTSPPCRILIIKPSAIGDVVHTLPILNLIRAKWPEAHIAWLVTPTCSGLLDGHPQLDEVIHFERKKFGAMWKSPGAAMGLFRFGRELKARQFDLVIDLQGLFRSGWLAWKTGAPVRVGFANAREMAPLFYTHRVPIDTVEQHAIDRYLTLAESIGCGRSPVEFKFATNDEDRRFVANLLGDDSPYAVVLPGTNWATKRWPVEHFAGLVTPLKDRFGLRTIVAGGPGDTELAKQIAGSLDLTGKTNLRQLIALLERATVVIANDSGPMHIASALGRPLVTPYGPTSPVRTGPYGRMDTVIRLDIVCSPCFSRTCSHQSCLQWLGPEPVLKEIERQIGVPVSITSSSSQPSSLSSPTISPGGI